MHARWYSPGTGSFDSADTVDNPAVGESANANPYAYGDDAPLTNSDPSGHNPLALVGVIAYKTYQDNHCPLTHESGSSSGATHYSHVSHYVLHRVVHAP